MNDASQSPRVLYVNAGRVILRCGNVSLYHGATPRLPSCALPSMKHRTLDAATTSIIRNLHGFDGVEDEDVEFRERRPLMLDAQHGIDGARPFFRWDADKR